VCAEVGFLTLYLDGVTCKLKMSNSKRVFVTVGTTSFDKLIETVSETSIIEVCHFLSLHLFKLPVQSFLPIQL
jgi:hypothetical protein